ncbi:Chromatin SPT2 [Cynara cardunculus var. scolymus]|uniref:Chromatin SPT2 n=1 Tax=Cynara cardunculus var. scolymus TaxID=59895 RepID=A0A103XBV3_CYNCS|nr:Chromatin SPT2 [Cynara cardunculus var. scolymus]
MMLDRPSRYLSFSAVGSRDGFGVKAGPSGQKPGTASKLNSTSLEPRKQLGRNDGSGSARPSAPKTLPLKAPMVRKEKVISASVATGSMPGLHKLLHSKPAPSVHKKPYDDDDDRDMEAGFDDIMMEEKRRSVSLQNSLDNLDLILLW